MVRISSIDPYGRIWITTEDDEMIVVPVLASEAGYTIGNVEVGGGTKAMQAIDYGDGDAELVECREGDTFDDGEDMYAYIVRRTAVDSLEWVANVRD